MASRARAPGNAGLVRRPIPVAHDYCPNDLEFVCLNNLAGRLFITKIAGQSDWTRWAETTGDQDIIEAVAAANKAVEAAHKKVSAKLRRKAKEGEHHGSE